MLTDLEEELGVFYCHLIQALRIDQENRSRMQTTSFFLHKEKSSGGEWRAKWNSSLTDTPVDSAELEGGGMVYHD